MSMASYDFARANQAITDRGVDALLDALGCQYLRQGGYIYLQSYPASGASSFCCFSNGTYHDFKTGRGGDLVALIGAVQNYSNQLDALKWANGYLGWGDLPAGQRPSDAELLAREAAARKREADAAIARAAKEKQCRAQYFHAVPAHQTLVQTYLEGRGIDFSRLKKIPGLIKFEPAARYYYGQDQFTIHPAMLSAFFRDGNIVGLHRTFLRTDGRGKADLTPAKKMYGTKRGAVLPVWKGDGNLTVSAAVRANKKQILAITEGIEDALSVAMVRPDYRVWAAGDIGNMMTIIPPECAAGIVLVADNDGDTPQARQTNFQAVYDYWLGAAAGRPLHVARSKIGKDFNDWVASLRVKQWMS